MWCCRAAGGLAADLRVVTGDNVALHARDLELVGLVDLRHQPVQDAYARRLDQAVVLDPAILSPLVAVIDHAHGLVADLRHVAGTIVPCLS